MEERLDYILISNPRAASVALNRLLGWNFKFNHCPARMIRNEIGADEWERAFSFGVVRHPLDRLVSWYFYHRKFPGDYFNKEVYQTTFREWVLAECPHHWQFTPQVAHQWLVHPLNQWEYVYDGDESIVSLIGRYENLGPFIETLCDKLGLAPERFRRFNFSDREDDYLSYFDAETKEIACRLFKEDFDRFGYEL